jgi:DHA1 family multidrug resistance protein-like MFS transporter
LIFGEQDMQTSNRKNLLILAFALIVVTLGFGVVMPIVPFYMENLGAGGTELGLLVASYAVMRLIFGPIWGSISDRVGRKPIMMIGVFGYGITMVLFGLATKLWMLFAARILAGILSSATSPTTMAYISDSTSEEDRGGGMGILGAAAGVGTIIGPAMGGLLAEKMLSLPFFIAGGMSVASVILIATLLPESLSKADRVHSSVSENPIDLRAWWHALFSPIGIFLVLIFLVTGGMMIFYGVFGLYALERFGYDTSQVGVLFMVLGLLSALGQGLLVGPLTKRFGDMKVIRIGFPLSAIGLIFIMLASQYGTLIAALGFFSLANALLIPAITSQTSKHADVPQGVAMGLSNSFISLGRIFGPILGGWVFDLDWRFTFIVGAVFMLAGFVVSIARSQNNPSIARQ